MAKCTVKNDLLVIIEEITTYGDIRLERRGDNWNATPRQRGFGSGWAPTRCGAVWKFLSQVMGETDQSRSIYGDAAAAIVEQFPEDSPPPRSDPTT